SAREFLRHAHVASSAGRPHARWAAGRGDGAHGNRCYTCIAKTIAPRMEMRKAPREGPSGSFAGWGGGPGGQPGVASSRSSRRRILPTLVLGSSERNSTKWGRL